MCKLESRICKLSRLFNPEAGTIHQEKEKRSDAKPVARVAGQRRILRHLRETRFLLPGIDLTGDPLPFMSVLLTFHKMAGECRL